MGFNKATDSFLNHRRSGAGFAGEITRKRGSVDMPGWIYGNVRYIFHAVTWYHRSAGDRALSFAILYYYTTI